MKKQFEKFRPIGFKGNGDIHLYPLIIKLSKDISKLEEQYSDDLLKLDENQNFIMSNLLIEFAEDLHNDIGLWKSIEYYNNSMFNTPLPLFVDENYIIKDCFDNNRIKYFIYFKTEFTCYNIVTLWFSYIITSIPFDSLKGIFDNNSLRMFKL